MSWHVQQQEATVAKSLLAACRGAFRAKRLPSSHDVVFFPRSCTGHCRQQEVAPYIIQSLLGDLKASHPLGTGLDGKTTFKHSISMSHLAPLANWSRPHQPVPVDQ
ncbi:hypothetical protein ACP70R_029944 [Stipagrostis hirtigluma subsp. patula]